MTVDVVYEGLTIATAAAARAEGDALFIELESPMPIGTALVIRSGEGSRAARVERVHEGQGGAGVIVRFGGKQAEPAKPNAAEATKPEPKQPEADADEADEKSQEQEPKGRKRKNTRKTVLGH